MGDDLVAVIMAGGAGTRFWPVSTEACPKQFLTLFGQRSLLQRTWDRVVPPLDPARVLVLTGHRFVGQVQRQLPGLPLENIIAEPMRRDTAAAVVLAAALCRRRFGNPVMAVLTSDHLIEPVELFQQALGSAAGAARRSGEALYTFGIRPHYPATGFGYLHLGRRLLAEGDVEHFQLQGFVEKPDLDTARRYLASGEYRWNSGMFVWTTDAVLAEAERLLPRHLEHLTRAVESDGSPAFAEALVRHFEPLPRVSVDFGIMEKAACVRCVTPGFQWSDVGGWLALEEHLAADAHGNHHRGEVCAADAGGNLVFCEEAGEVVALVGVRDLVVVRCGNKTLVVHRDRTEAIKDLVSRLPEELK